MRAGAHAHIQRVYATAPGTHPGPCTEPVRHNDAHRHRLRIIAWRETMPHGMRRNPMRQNNHTPGRRIHSTTSVVHSTAQYQGSPRHRYTAYKRHKDYMARPTSSISRANFKKRACPADSRVHILDFATQEHASHGRRMVELPLNQT